MGIETKDVRELLDEEGPEEVLFGRKSSKKLLPYPEGTVFRVFIGCLNNDEDRLEYEQLLTKSYQCQNILEKQGDLAIITIQGTFDKEGCYHVVARYAFLAEVKNTTKTKE